MPWRLRLDGGSGMSDKEILIKGLAQLGVVLADAAQQQLLDYIALLQKWNKVHNLISRKESDNLVVRHLLDSLVALPYINGSRVVDVGSGAGLPGIPLAIACPQCRFTLLDCNSKKARFRNQAAIELGLKNVTVVDARAEKFYPEQGFDSVISRAFATIADMLAVAGHLAAPGGQFLAMKGVYPEQELAELPGGYQLEAVHPLGVPLLGAERHLVVVTRTKD